jgi:hypothetical protein
MMNAEEITKFFQPSRKGELRFQMWRLHTGYWQILRRAPLSLRERGRLALVLGRMLYWDGPKLVRDFGEGLRLIAPRA